MRVEGEGVMIDEMGSNVSIGRCWSVYKLAGVWVGPVPSFIVKGTHNNQRQSRWSRTPFDLIVVFAGSEGSRG